MITLKKKLPKGLKGHHKLVAMSQKRRQAKGWPEGWCYAGDVDAVNFEARLDFGAAILGLTPLASLPKASNSPPESPRLLEESEAPADHQVEPRQETAQEVQQARSEAGPYLEAEEPYRR